MLGKYSPHLYHYTPTRWRILFLNRSSFHITNFNNFPSAWPKFSLKHMTMSGYQFINLPGPLRTKKNMSPFFTKSFSKSEQEQFWLTLSIYLVPIENFVATLPVSVPMASLANGMRGPICIFENWKVTYWWLFVYTQTSTSKLREHGLSSLFQWNDFSTSQCERRNSSLVLCHHFRQLLQFPQECL